MTFLQRMFKRIADRFASGPHELKSKRASAAAGMFRSHTQWPRYLRSWCAECETPWTCHKQGRCAKGLSE